MMSALYWWVPSMPRDSGKTVGTLRWLCGHAFQQQLSLNHKVRFACMWLHLCALHVRPAHTVRGFYSNLTPRHGHGWAMGPTCNACGESGAQPLITLGVWRLVLYYICYKLYVIRTYHAHTHPRVTAHHSIHVEYRPGALYICTSYVQCIVHR